MPEGAEAMATFEQQLSAAARNTVIAALEVVPFAMLIIDAGGRALAANHRWADLSGIDRAASAGSGWLSVLDPESADRLLETVARVAADGRSATVDLQVGAGAERRWMRWWVSRHDLDGTALLAVAAADVQEDYARQATLYHQATHDSLTGLVNRSHFLDCIDQALRRGSRQQRKVAVVYVDLDDFKRVNDRGGHSLGDRVLNAIASRLRHSVRSADMVARIGGDEFAVLCEGLTAAEQAELVARRIAAALTETVELDGQRWSVAASVGAAVDRGEAEAAEDLVERADRAMYSVKLARRPAEAGTAAESLAPAFATRTGVDPGSRPSDVRSGPVGPVGPPPGPPGGAGVGAAVEGREVAPPTLQVLDPEDARRALRELAEMARQQPTGPPAPAASVPPPVPPATEVAPAAPSAWETSGPPPAGPAERQLTATAVADPARQRLADDVLHLRETINSIRQMLDRLLGSAEGGEVIDIRDTDR
jgi:diguanylate cyclase (GGDEF)-like protein/PAS domain S-box-containing protein